MNALVRGPGSLSLFDLADPDQLFNQLEFVWAQTVGLGAFLHKDELRINDEIYWTAYDAYAFILHDARRRQAGIRNSRVKIPRLACVLW